MSQNIKRAQIRSYAANPPHVATGAAVVPINIEFETVVPTKMIAFGALSVTTVAANAILTAAWLTNVQIIINQTEYVVPNMTRNDYINVVQNLEIKEGDLLLGTGNMMYKLFKPALPAQTKVQIQLVANTTALVAAGPPATCNLTPICLAFDSLAIPERKLTYYAPLPVFPPVAGVVVGVDIPIQLGNFARTEKAICLIAENPLATPVDTWLGRLQLRADGQTVIDLNTPEMKKEYAILSDGLPVPAGWHCLMCPEGGFQAASNNQLQLLATPYFTIAAAIGRGYEIFEKAY